MLFLNHNLAVNYKSNSQKIRVMSEFWTWKNIICPNCWNKLTHYQNNKPVADFYCDECKEEYELKAWKKLGNKINDWAYNTMIKRLKDNNNPNFFFLDYDSDTYKIKNFMVIPKHFFTPEIIEKRKSLSENARRAWRTGCNVLINNIPKNWKIFYIKDGSKINTKDIISNWNKTVFLKEKLATQWRWRILDIMKCIDAIDKTHFTLEELYSFENKLKTKYPKNNFIKDKIRQQLQFLRNKWYIEFIKSGEYKVL